MKHVLFLTLIATLLGIVASQPSSDPCAFPDAPSPWSVAWVTDRTALLTCFDSVPFNATNRDILFTILNYTWHAYPFQDYVAQPIPPYNVQVRPVFGPESSPLPSLGLASCTLSLSFGVLSYLRNRFFILSWISLLPQTLILTHITLHRCSSSAG